MGQRAPCGSGQGMPGGSDLKHETLLLSGILLTRGGSIFFKTCQMGLCSSIEIRIYSDHSDIQKNSTASSSV